MIKDQELNCQMKENLDKQLETVDTMDPLRRYSTVDYESAYEESNCIIRNLQSQLRCYEEQLKTRDTTIEELKSTIKTLSKLI